VRAVVGGIDDEGVIGDAEVIRALRIVPTLFGFSSLVLALAASYFLVKRAHVPANRSTAGGAREPMDS